MLAQSTTCPACHAVCTASGLAFATSRPRCGETVSLQPATNGPANDSAQNRRSRCDGAFVCDDETHEIRSRALFGIATETSGVGSGS